MCLVKGGPYEKKFFLPLLLAAALLLGAWYFWPRTLTGALSGLDQQGIALCDAVLVPRDPGSGLESRIVRVEMDSQEFHQLMELLTSTRYVRSPADLLSWGTSSSVITLEPYSADLIFHQQDGRSHTLQFYGPDLTLNDRTYIPLDGTGFQQQVADLLSACPDVEAG